MMGLDLSKINTALERGIQLEHKLETNSLIWLGVILFVALFLSLALNNVLQKTL